MTYNRQLLLKGRKVTLRTAEPEDAEAIIALVHRLDEETTFLMREPGEFEMTLEAERELLRRFEESPTQRFLVAEVDGEIVGTSDVAIGQRSRVRHSAEIGVGVQQAHWGLGIGRALMEENIAWLREEGVERIGLTVDAQNLRAVALYMRLGFVVEGTLLRHRRLADGSYRDDYRMALHFL